MNWLAALYLLALTRLPSSAWATGVAAPSPACLAGVCVGDRYSPVAARTNVAGMIVEREVGVCEGRVWDVRIWHRFYFPRTPAKSDVAICLGMGDLDAADALTCDLGGGSEALQMFLRIDEGLRALGWRPEPGSGGPRPASPEEARATTYTAIRAGKPVTRTVRLDGANNFWVLSVRERGEDDCASTPNTTTGSLEGL